MLIDGSLQEETLIQALAAVINQHEILRTTFHHRPGFPIPIQIIAAQSWPNITRTAAEYHNDIDQASFLRGAVA